MKRGGTCPPGDPLDGPVAARNTLARRPANDAAVASLKLRMTSAQSLMTIELATDTGEASALTPCLQRAWLEAHGFDHGFWTVLDEGRVEHSIAFLGHRHGAPLDEGWIFERVEAAPTSDDKTEDAECLAHHGEFLYVLGSHFGKKKGPLQAKRCFLARFSERALDGALGDARLDIEIARRPFVLHRLLNDYFHQEELSLIALGPHARQAYIETTLAKAFKEDKAWGPLIRVDDWPLNLEGLAFAGPKAYLGLRFPMDAEGHPLIVALEGLERLFEPDEEPPRVTGAWALTSVGEPSFPVGIRGLELVDDALHVLTGPIDTARKHASLVYDYPGSKQTACGHWRIPLDGLTGTNTAPTECVRVFDQHDHIEGVCRSGEHWFYVADFDDKVVLHIAPV